MEEENRTHKIYMYTNLINGKIYIGQTKNSIAKRADNGRGYDRCPAFYNAIQKYGLDNFSVDILADHLSQDEANELEAYYINLYNSTNKEKGYNIRVGGNASEAVHRKAVMCLETGKVYPSIADAGEDTGVNYRMISECCNHTRGYKSAGGYHWCFCDPDTKEHEAVYVRKVLCEETNTLYNSCAEAARDLGLVLTSVPRVCDKPDQSLHGYHFRHVYEEVKENG